MGGVHSEEPSRSGRSVAFDSIGQSISATASRIRADIAFALVDVIVVVASYTLGLALRMLDPLVGDVQKFWEDLLLTLPFIVAIHIVANALGGAYGHVWEHASTNEAVRVIGANAAASGVILALSTWVRPNTLGADGIVIPYSTLVIGGFLAMGLMGLVRFRSRLFSFRKQTGASRILVVGSGFEAAAFARRAPEVDGGGRIIGFLADGEMVSEVRHLAGQPILGGINDIANVVAEQRIDQVVVVGRDPVRSRAVVDGCMNTDVRLRILPLTSDVMAAKEALADVRDIAVEDLLTRDPVVTDLSALTELIQGKRVMVTGAGGSIGSEIVRQVLEFEPGEVCALDRDETLLHDGSLMWPGPTRIVLGDVRDSTGILRTFQRIRPQIVFHAAALKHVPVLEEYPDEAVLVNVIGTRNVMEAGSRVNMERFVLISTDKAVHPTSVMGGSKRVAELLVKAGTERNDGCTYTAVRFGNVLGSRGSVTPTFVAQVKAGGPVTITDPEMTRYFMTVYEAVQLVLQASAMATGSEVFVLDMGESVKIEDLARRLIRLAGLTPDVDIAIKYTGRRPGEKLRERLADGPLGPTENAKIFKVPLRCPHAHILFDRVADMEEAARSGDKGRVIAMLNALSEGQLNGSSEVYEPDSQLSLSWS